ncbi:MAG: Spy/CpxP family protein refolding chaperone [Nostochopsis sp.]
MKFKYILALVSFVTVVTATASITHAQTPPVIKSEAFLVSQMPGFSNIDALKLTSDQKNRLQKVQDNFRSRLGEILTSEQRDKWQKAIAEGKSPQEVMKIVNPSSGQKRKLRKVMQSQQEQVNNILTPEQREQMRNMGGNGQNRNMPRGMN